MTELRSALVAVLISVAAGIGWQGSATAADQPVADTREKPWQFAQAPQRHNAKENDERKRRSGQESRREERRQTPRRGEPQKVDRSSRKAEPAQTQRRSAAPTRNAQKKTEPPRKEARPPVAPRVINERKKAEDARKKLPARQKEAIDNRRRTRDARKDSRPAPREKKEARPARRLEDLKKARRERVEAGGRKIIEADKRTIVREKGRMIIRHDETERFRRRFKDARIERRDGGGRIARFVRPDGVHIVSEYDSHDRLVRRYRRYRDGRTVIIIDNSRHYSRPGFIGGLVIGALLNLPPPVVHIPREKYIVEYEDASYDDVYEALSAPPVEELDRDYSLEEIRYNHVLRDRMRRIDLDSINFEFGSCDVDEDEYDKLEWIGEAINRLLERNSEEVILIEGYTDAVGSEEDNMLLSDCRAEEVASILSEEFDVPAENLVTQGYGEQFLKIDTQEPERENRRVAVRRVTPLLSRAGP